MTDHYRVQDSKGLVQAARAAGLFAFSGFEAVTKDGVHLLCLFDPEKDNVLERFIGECGVHDTNATSPTGSLDTGELLTSAKRWGAVCIAAHVAAEGGFLTKLSGQSRVNAWRLLIFSRVPWQVRFRMHQTTYVPFLKTKTESTSATAR